MKIIPWQDQDYFEQIITLGNRSYTMIAQYNYRDDGWYFSLYFNDNLLVINRKIIMNTDLLASCDSVYRPVGWLIVSSTLENTISIDRKNILSEYFIAYVTLEDYP